MKPGLYLLIITLPIFLFSCGGGNTTENSQEEEKEVVKKTTSLSDKDNMMARLKELDITIPSEMEFVEIKRNAGEYTVQFMAADLDEATIEKLKEWYENQCQDFVSDGYVRRNMRDNEEMMGMIFNNDLFISSSEGIDFSSVLNEKEKTFKIYIQPGS